MPNMGNEIANTPHFNMSMHLPLTPYGLPLAIWDLIEQNWTDKNILFTQSYPREDVKRPTIVWKIYRRVPGREGLETNKPRFRMQIEDVDDPSISYDQYAQYMTIIYQFDIFGINNASVNELTEEFDELMFYVTPALKELGVSEWLFEEQLIDTELERQVSQELYKRTLRFRCILERKFIKAVPTIQSIWVQQGIEAAQKKENELVIRGSSTTRDQLENLWVSNVWSVTKEFKLEFSSVYTSGTQYLEGVDYNVVLIAPTGQSYIDWIQGSKHPLPGEGYYVTYFYRNIDLNYPA